MEPVFSDSVGDHPTYEFAFNSSNFSDRVLRIEIVAGPTERKAVGASSDGTSDWARHRKRRREDLKKENDLEFSVDNSTTIASCNSLHAVGNFGEEVVTMVESPSGDDHSQSSDSSWGMDATVIREKNIFISSAILAARSPFFYKLFSNGMRESDQRDATLQINASEESALMELLNFIYSGKLTTSSQTLLLEILMIADKFEVVSCMKLCSELLRSLPMTKESALLYLDLPISSASASQPLIDAAKEFLVNHFKDLTKVPSGLMDLPLVGIETIFSSNDIQVASEDSVYDLVLKWARRHYPDPEERKDILCTRLHHLIRFPHMSCRKLNKILNQSDLDQGLASEAILEALFFKTGVPRKQCLLAEDDLANKRFVERAYKYRPVKVTEYELPYPQCIVCLDLKREDCARLYPSGRIYSQAFHLGGQGFFLSAHCNLDQHSSVHCFGLFLGMQERCPASFKVEYEFAARTRPSGEFAGKYKGCYNFTGGKAVGYRNLFAISWTNFIADDSLYFINDMLHLKAGIGHQTTIMRAMFLWETSFFCFSVPI